MFPLQNLNGGDISNFVDELSNTTSQNVKDVVTSQATVASIVSILDNVAEASNNIIVDQGVMTVGVKLVFILTIMMIVLPVQLVFMVVAVAPKTFPYLFFNCFFFSGFSWHCDCHCLSGCHYDMEWLK